MAAPKLGVVLGGTGVRGFAQAGVLHALERAGHRPDVLVGVSSAAVVAATYAARGDWSEALLHVDRTRLPTLPSPTGEDALARLRGALRGARQLAPSVWSWGRRGVEGFGAEVLEELLGRGLRFRSTRLPVALVATELGRARRVVLDDGDLAMAALAASALPGITRPVSLGGRQLVDGAFSDPAPVDVARDLGADVVLAAVPFGPGEADGWPLETDPEGPVAGMLRGLAIGQRAFVRERLAEADIALRADLGEEVRLLDFAGLDAAVRRAHDDALDAIDEVERLRGSPA